MSNPKQLLIDPGIYSLLATAIDKSSIEVDEASELTGVKKDRVKKWTKSLENFNIIKIKQKGESQVITFNPGNKEKIGNILKKADREREEKHEEVQDKLESLNLEIIKKMSEIEDEDKIEELQKVQKSIFDILDKLDEKDYVGAESAVNEIQIPGEGYETPGKADFHHLRKRENLIRKWGTPKE